LEQSTVSFSRRDDIKEVIRAEVDNFIKSISRTLLDIQASMPSAAKAKLAANTEKTTTLENFKKSFERKNNLHAFVLAPFVDDEKVKAVMDELWITVRCVPLVQPNESATCLFTGKKTSTWALYAKSY
jgi:prolyl-tRNA synthetase